MTFKVLMLVLLYAAISNTSIPGQNEAQKILFLRNEKNLEPKKNHAEGLNKLTETVLNINKLLIEMNKNSLKPINCDEHFSLGDEVSGIKTIYPFYEYPERSVNVFCHQIFNGTEKGGWTVIQARKALRKREDFNRTWIEYVQGFGEVAQEHWLGLENIHALTNNKLMELRIYMEDFKGDSRIVRYKVFYVDGKDQDYKLTINRHEGNTKDALAEHNGKAFYTIDHDNELKCARKFRGGWWFKSCHTAFLNGYQHKGDFNTFDGDGIVWTKWKGYKYSLKTIEMSIRPVFTQNKEIECGISTKIIRKVVGGKDAAPRDWPWMAALMDIVQYSTPRRQFCGGTLISNKHVLTAAHCFDKHAKEKIVVRLGELNFNSTEDNKHIDFYVSELKIHENYDSETLESDIAIITLAKPATFGEFIRQACLPPPSDTFEHYKAFALGWGLDDYGGKFKHKLQNVELPIWNITECNKANEKGQLPYENLICAAPLEGDKDTCEGDSGGPLLVQIAPYHQWHLVGITSWGVRCAEKNLPGMYTRVNKYLAWINQNMRV